MDNTEAIFISYARADSQVIAPILKFLRESGYRHWIDEEDIEGATFWRREIVEAIVRCPLVIFLASERSCHSLSVAKELALASDEYKPILPVFLHELILTPEIRYQVAGLQSIFYYQDADRGKEQLLVVLSRLVHPPVAPLVPSTPAGAAATTAAHPSIYSSRAASIISSDPQLIRSLDRLQKFTNHLWKAILRLDASKTECWADIQKKTFDMVSADLDQLVSLGHLRYLTKYKYNTESTGELVLDIHLRDVTTQLSNLAKAINERPQ